jgi:Conjugal transfer protein
MHPAVRILTLSTLALSTTLGCGLHETYPPAYPAPTRIPWDNHEAFVVNNPPPPELAWRDPPKRLNPAGALVPGTEEWHFWQLQAPVKTVCTGKGKRRRCRQVRQDPVEQANADALVRPTALYARQGTNGLWRYPLDTTTDRVYEVQTSPSEATYLLLPEGERLAAKLLLNPAQWEVSYGKNGAEGSRREVVALRPTAAPLRARTLLVLQSGVPIHLSLVAREQAGMLSVSWEVPARPVSPPTPTPDQLPPRFEREQAYAGYAVTVEGKKPATPPWLPEAVMDDGKNTLVKFPGTLDGVRVPVVQGIQQNGAPALVQSRLYVRPEHGAWLYVQGLWPALRLTDAAGIKVKVVRDVPKPTEVSDAY